MALDQRHQRLLDTAQRALGTTDVRNAIKQVKAIIGPDQIPDSERLAQIALEKMRNGQIPSPEEIAALTIVIRILRPVFLTARDSIAELPRDPEHDLHTPADRARWEDARQIIGPLLPSIGRLERANGEHVGTGFLVRDDLLATNRHVLSQLTFGTEIILPSQPARICFGQIYGELDGPNDTVDILEVVAIHPDLDVALLRVPPQTRARATLAPEAVPEALPVATAGYSAKDKQNPLFLEPVFNNVFGKKRVALGEVLSGGGTSVLFHDCSTTQGNSGSPVFSLESRRVVAIHAAGRFMYRNEAVPCAAWIDLVDHAPA